MRITSKRQMYELQDRRLLGNCLPTMTWRQFEDFLGECSDARCAHGRFGLRHRNKVGFPYTRPVGSATEFFEYVHPLLRDGIMTEDDVLITDITDLDDTRKTLQGEIWRDPSLGLVLYHSGSLCQTWTCRDEMRRPTGVVERVGLVARAFVDTFMDEPSRDTLEELLRDYDDSVIEISCFEYRLGWQMTNTLFWEVRNY